MIFSKKRTNSIQAHYLIIVPKAQYKAKHSSIQTAQTTISTEALVKKFAYFKFRPE